MSAVHIDDTVEYQEDSLAKSALIAWGARWNKIALSREKPAIHSAHLRTIDDSVTGAYVFCVGAQTSKVVAFRKTVDALCGKYGTDTIGFFFPKDENTMRLVLRGMYSIGQFHLIHHYEK